MRVMARDGWGLAAMAVAWAAFLAIGLLSMDSRSALQQTDPQLYLSTAKAMVRNGVWWLPTPGEIAADYQLAALYVRSFVTPAIGGALLGAVGPDRFEAAIVVLDIGLVSLCIPTLYAAGCRLGSAAAGAVAAWCFLLMWDPLVLAQAYLTESFAMFGAAMAVLLLSLATATGWRGGTAAACLGVVLALMALNHGSMLTVIVAAALSSGTLLAVLLGRRAIARAAERVIIGGAVFGFAMLPFVVGQRVTGFASGQGGIGLGGGGAWTMYVDWVPRDNVGPDWQPTPVDYALAESYAGPDRVEAIGAAMRAGTLDVDDCLKREIEPVLGLGGKAEAITDAMYRRATLCNMWAERGVLPRLIVKRLVNYLRDSPVHNINIDVRTGASPLDGALRAAIDATRDWRSRALFALALAGVVLAVARRRPVLIVLGVAVAIHTGAMVVAAPQEVRYKLPVVPLACVLAGYAVAEMLAYAARREFTLPRAPRRGAAPQGR